MINKIFNNFNALLKEEKDNLILWLPIFFGIGIALSFLYLLNFSLLFLINVIFLTIYIYVNKYYTKKLNYLLVPLFFVLFGYNRCFLFIKNNKIITIEKYIGESIIYGKIESDKKTLKESGGYRKEIVMNVEKIFVVNDNEYLKKEETPKKMLIRLENDKNKIFFSNSVVKSNIYPIKKQKFFSSFNTKRYLNFMKIGATAYNGEILENDNFEKLNLNQKINRFRYNFANKIIAARNSKSTTIIATLLTGQKNLADKEAIKSMNYSGLSHLLAISGLHMMTLIAFVFFITKWLLLRSEKIAIKYNVIKISAFVSLFFNFFYLVLSGFGVSSIRAYVMSTILLFSYLINRFNDAKRSIMIVMFAILFCSPSSLFNIGFQLSFLSIISITAVVEYFNDYKRNREKTIFSDSLIEKIFDYTMLSFLISLTAELATTPITVYNFNNYTFYNVFTNIVAGPIVSIIILPSSIMAILFYFVNLEYLFVIPSSYLIDFILKISDFVLSIPNSILFIRSPNYFSMVLAVLSIFWFSLFKTKIRKISYLLYFISALFVYFQKVPDVVIDKEDKSIYLVNENKKISVYNPKKYSANEMIKKLEKDEYKNITSQTKKNKYLIFKKFDSQIKINVKNLNFYSKDINKIKRENDLLLIYLKK